MKTVRRIFSCIKKLCYSMYAQAKIYGCLVNKAGSFGFVRAFGNFDTVRSGFVREFFLKALFFGVCSFGHIFSSDQLWYGRIM